MGHLVFPDDRQDVLHAFGSPQEVEDPQVHDHALRREDRPNVARDVVFEAEDVPTSVSGRYLHTYTQTSTTVCKNHRYANEYS